MSAAGIYDDINQVISAQHYWNPAITANATVRRYIASQYSQKPEVIDAVSEAIALLEQVYPMGDPADPSRGFPAYPLGPDGACYHFSCGSSSSKKIASRSLRRALLMSQVNPGSLYRCGKRT